MKNSPRNTFLHVLFGVCSLYNVRIFYLINGNHHPAINGIMFYFAQFGDGYVAALIVILLYVKSPKHSIAGIIP